MNNKFGADRRYRQAREPFWRGTDGDGPLLSPDQEFETSGNYREPREPEPKKKPKVEPKPAQKSG